MKKLGMFFVFRILAILYTFISHFYRRRSRERNKLAREKQLREAAEREKAAMEQRLIQYQEEIRLANEALVSYSYDYKLFTKYKYVKISKLCHRLNLRFREGQKKPLIY